MTERVYKTSARERQRSAEWSRTHRERKNELSREWCKKNHDKALAHARNSRIRAYGISVERYEALLGRQGGLCAICGAPPMQRRLAIDHDHVTGIVRGLLCIGCNKSLERIEKFPDWGTLALAYLKPRG